MGALEEDGQSPQVAFGRRVRAVRRALGLEQEEFAELLGWTQQKVSRLETGAKVTIDFADLVTLAQKTDADIHELATGKQRQPISKLAADISKLKMDHWGEDAVLTLARREAKRAAEQADPFSEIERQMLSEGHPPERVAQLVEGMRQSRAEAAALLAGRPTEVGTRRASPG